MADLVVSIDKLDIRFMKDDDVRVAFQEGEKEPLAIISLKEAALYFNLLTTLTELYKESEKV